MKTGRRVFFQPSVFVIRVPIEKDSDILFSQDVRRQFVSRAMKRAIANYAFVCRIH